MRRTSSNWHQKATWGMTLGLISALALLLTLRPGFFGALSSSLEYDTLDFWFALRDSRQSDEVVILAVDEGTLRSWNGENFRARDIATAIRRLKSVGARSVALSFPQLCDPRLRVKDETELIAAMRFNGRVVLPLEFRQFDASLSAQSASLFASPQVGAARNFALSAPEIEALVPRGDKALDGTWRMASPSPQLLGAAAGVGHLNFILDRFGRVRRLPLYMNFEKQFYPSLAASTMHATGAPLPIAEGDEMLLNYPYGAVEKGAVSPAFRIVSLADALRDQSLMASMSNRVVIIGSTASGVASRFPTPMGKRVSATELQAVALDNVLSGAPLRRAPEEWHWLLSILSGVIVGGFAASRRPTWSGPVALLCVLTVALASVGLFSQDIWLDTSVPWLTIAITFLVGVIGRARRQERENTHITSTVEALTRVSDIIAAQTHEWELLDRVCHFATGALNATGASALILDEKREFLTFAAALGPNSDKLVGMKLRMGEGIAGHVAQSGEIAIVGEARGDGRFAPRLDAHTGFSTQNILCVPLRVRERMLGVIEVVNRENGALFTAADAEMLQAVANQAAVALDNARLYDRLEQRVEESQDALAVANRQLQDDKNLLQTVLHSMTDGVVVTDSRGQIQLLNPAASEFVPELAPEVVGRPLSSVVEDFPLAVPASNQQNVALPLLERGNTDAPLYLEVSSAPLKTPDGELTGIVTVLADVTQRRHIEQAKSDFVSFVAHEMRSPLTSISGFSAMLQKNEGAEERGSAPIPPASRARFLGLIHEESERLTRLINNLLDVAKLEAGHHIELNRDRVDFARIANSALESQRAYSSRHTLIQEWKEPLPLIEADADKVTQILINLLSNALKYSPRGLVTLAARADGDWMEVSVSDQGPGIAPEQMGLLFSRFGRTPTPAQGAGSGAKPTGTGLGLFLSKHLVEAHGGRIWVESAPQGGATFRFTLPLARDF